MNNVVIAGYARTPIGNFMGALASLSAVELGIAASKKAIENTGITSEEIEEVVVGMVCKAGAKGNPARQISIALNVPVQASASTVDQQCASGMRAVEMAMQQIALGNCNCILAVGMESMSNVPHLMLNARKGVKMGSFTIEDSLLYDALHDAMLGYHMGLTAETLSENYGITREEQDELALLSNRRALDAIEQGKFDEEIVPIEIKTRNGNVIVDRDEHPRANLQIEDLSKLRPAFKKVGTVTAGNASGVNDGAAAIVLMSEDYANKMSVKPIARLLATTSMGVDPAVMGIGPAFVIPKLLSKCNMKIDDIDYYELNEAFAAQFLACNRELKLSMEKVNANGSGIALGHPIGCTGTRIIIATAQELKRRGKKYGIASLCVGGGPAMATLIEMI